MNRHHLNPPLLDTSILPMNGSMNASDSGINWWASKLWTQQKPPLIGGFPSAQACCVMETLRSMQIMIPQKADLPWTMRKTTQREVLWLSLCSSVSITPQKPSLLWPEWILLWDRKPGNSNFCQSTDNRADSLCRRCRKWALCCCRLHYGRQRWRFWSVLTCRRHEYTGRDSCEEEYCFPYG